MSKYRLVPVEPTEHMLDSGQYASFRDIETQDAARIYEAMLTAAPEAGWQPIETAPKDGTAVLLYYGEDYYVMEGRCFPTKASFQGRGSPYKWVSAVDMGDLQPTHWVPLPLPPKGC